MRSALNLSNPFGSDRRLAVYGSLLPGRENHEHVAGIRGEWRRGRVTGHLHQLGSYPALEWDPDGPAVPVHVLESPQLPEHWARLDAFEGEGYRRVVVPVELDSGETTAANVYVAPRSCSAR